MTVEVYQGSTDVDLIGKSGETFRAWFIFTEEDGTTPIHLGSLSTARLKVKSRPEDTAAIFDLQIGSGLTVNASAGKIEVFFSDESSAQKSGEAFFDLRLNFANGDTYYLVGGTHELRIPVTT